MKNKARLTVLAFLFMLQVATASALLFFAIVAFFDRDYIPAAVFCTISVILVVALVIALKKVFKHEGTKRNDGGPSL